MEILKGAIILSLVLLGCGKQVMDTANSGYSIKSLTSSSFTGKKYYLGYGGMADGSQTNEIIYDVKHTSDVFTKELGGEYIGTTLLYPEASHESVLGKMEEIRNKSGGEDMYVQYSSGHGMESGSQAGADMLGYDEIRDNALSMKSKEVIIFLMACYSGGLTESFNSKKEVWQNWESQGRNLFVMSSSRIDQESSSGPGTDRDEATGEDGSAGSAFGHYLWKALLGEADGYVDGVRDGFVSLGELAAFVRDKTEANFGHTPTFTGSYNPYLVMNRAVKVGGVDGN